MNEAYWDTIAPTYRAQVHDSLAADREGVICRWMDAFASPIVDAVDFGCGVGRYLDALSRRFRCVHALDHSQACLDQARRAHRQLKNVEYRKADLSRPLRNWKPLQFGTCMNVLIAPNDELRSAMIRTMHRALARGGHLMVVVPALESALYTDQRLIEWRMRDGLPRQRAVREALRDEQGIIGPAAAGIVTRGDEPTKHYLCEEAMLMLRRGGFQIEAVDKVQYSWADEFFDPPRWLREPYPWHWLLVCTRLR